MKRRHFLMSSAAILVASPALAAVEYTPGLVQQELDAGKTVFLDFKAAWCSTCAVQEQVINALRTENPSYDEAISFINVDWDQHRSGALVRALNIPRRSTLVVLKGDEELGRIVAGTAQSDIKALLDTALAAASA
ncbi:MAG: thioredoxin family protein [Pseudomonadota bacterium]